MNMFLAILVVLPLYLDAFQINICQGQTKALSCSGESKLLIESANYGRTKRHVCRKPEGTNTDCINSVKKEVSAACKDKKRCSLTSTNQNFGNNCRGVSKYLEVVYGCKRTVTVCEGGSLQIKCSDNNGKITIQKAMYGRSDKTTCRKPTGDNSNNVCSADGARRQLKKSCDGKLSCRLSATNEVFGNPCRKTNKYLEVTYKCS